jgi:tetratricopeptide (TPR) repeat protein
MHVDVIDTVDDLLALRRNWNDVYEADPEANYFLSWIWISTWFRSRSLPWLVLGAKARAEDDLYVGFFPLQLGTTLDKGRGFHNTLSMGGSHFATYTGVLCDGAAADSVMAAFADRIRALRWTSVNLDDIYISADRLRPFLERFPASEFTTGKVARSPHVTGDGQSIDHDVYIYIDLPHDFESFLDVNLGPKTRRNARRALRALEASEELRIVPATEETIERDLELFYGFWKTQWAPTNPRYAAYILDCSRSMLLDCFRHGSLFLPVLWQGDRAIGVQVNFLDPAKKRFINFMTSRDLTVHRPGPSFLLHCYCIRWAIENGYSIYDLGTGDYAYKYMFGSEEHIVERFRITTRTRRNNGERLDPRSLTAVLNGARRLYASGDTEDAVIACRQILAVDPANADAMAIYRLIAATPGESSEILDGAVDMAFAYHRAGDLPEAEKRYREVLAVDPVNFDAVHQLGVLLLQRREPKAAEMEIRRALEIRPDAASAHCNHGNVLAITGDFEGAIVSYDRAIDLEPRHAIAFNNRGNALRRVSRFEDALASYEGALALQPEYQQASDNRAALTRELEGRAMSEP